MARDRKRAKQRRERRVREQARAASPNQPLRADVPGALEHASADVDEFDAALLRGAEGQPVEGEREPAPPDAGEEAPLDSSSAPDEELADEDDGSGDMLQEGPPATGAVARAGAAHDEAARPSGAPLREGNRVTGFLRASWAELQRVQWPDRRQVTQATAVVLGFVAVAGIYLGVADFVAKEIVEFIL